ncbi:uncharacterized protein LOC108808990 isoform X1 [Raphanus sativus]|uniref:Uncharacterized protein LOC108808990 isoform X1 n=1 Tax=Raphanus sativus TaxID=3726 RepID=A0A6J0JNK3_RAPSA|nr:uncharacterized protein LOC108808990 isoform X1 [Raphanus sativus]XP_018436606.2 uncharacterized protein LOC108808990 isoform X1 [Raphanus sativus]
MEKEICARHLSREGTGCVWLFMNMFDLRHGGSNHKLLMDKKRGSKRILDIETKVEKQLTCDCEKSVKKLIEEEIDEKTHQRCDTTECRGKTKARNEKRRSRTCSKASDDEDHAENQCPRTSQIDADSINDDSEEKFSELIRRLIDQKESEVESCKNLVDDDDDSKEESFLNIGTSPNKETSSPSESRAQTIVVLKPEPNCLNIGSSPGRNKAKNERFGSRFILSRIRRRLTPAKNPCNAQHESDQDPDALSSTMSQNSCLEDGEILPDNSSKSEANEEDTNQGREDSKKSMCGIYIAAKKHLSEMLAEGDMNVDLPDKEVPRLLGKILALPQFSTPDYTPRMTLAHDFVGHQITEKPNIQQCSSEDYSETLGLDSNKHEETTSTSDMSAGVLDTREEEKSVLDPLSADAYVDDEDKFETHDEHEHVRPLEKVETFDEIHAPSSPPISSVKMCQDNATDVPGKSSPVSVLEPFFTDDDTSPNSSRFSSVEMRLKPLCIRFEEPDSPRLEKQNNAKTRMDDKELALAYIQDVVTSSELNWEELLARSFYSEQVLEQALMDEIEFCSTNFCNDKELLFDCINEVLMEFCRHGPWISFSKPADMENAVEVVQEEVYWHLLPLPSPHTLDQIVRKDLARSGYWMDLSFDIGCIGSQTGEMILDELLDEIISSFTDLF